MRILGNNVLLAILRDRAHSAITHRIADLDRGAEIVPISRHTDSDRSSHNSSFAC